MLASITPLGERGRHSRFAVTASAFILASASAGALLGLALGAIGEALLSGGRGGLHGTSGGNLAPLVAIAAALAVGLAFDLRAGGLRLPTVRRQVDETWLARYRDWVYGAGFGAQLGAGLTTIVVSSAVYAAFLACLLCGSAAGGTVVGMTFGLARGLSLLPAAPVRDPDALMRLHRGLLRWEGAVRRASLMAQAVLALIAIALALGVGG